MKSMICAAALSALCLMSGPVHADEPVTASVVSADWTRQIEIWHLCCGKSARWGYQFTQTARGSYPDMPKWVYARLDSKRPQRERSKLQSYVLTVEDPVTERRQVIITSEEAWIRAAEAGEIEVLRDDDGTLRVKDTDIPINTLRVQEF